MRIAEQLSGPFNLSTMEGDSKILMGLFYQQAAGSCSGKRGGKSVCVRVCMRVWDWAFWRLHLIALERSLVKWYSPGSCCSLWILLFRLFLNLVFQCSHFFSSAICHFKMFICLFVLFCYFLYMHKYSPTWKIYAFMAVISKLPFFDKKKKYIT